MSMQGVPGLLEKVRAADRKGQWAEPLILRQYGPVPADAIAALVKQTEDKDPQVRAKAVLVLTQFGTVARPAVPALTRASKDENEQVRVLAALSLARIERKPLDNLEAIQNTIRRNALGFKQAAEKQMLAFQVREGVGEQIAAAARDFNHPFVVLQAINDPRVQTSYRQFFLFYISVVLASQANLGMTPVRAMLEQQIEQMGPECIPALVYAVNLVCSHRLGFV
jgi:hypothetical protein